MGRRRQAAPASSRNRPVQSAGPRRSVGSAVVTNAALLRPEEARRVVTAPQGKEKRPPVLPPSLKRTIDYRAQSAISFLDRSHLFPDDDQVPVPDDPDVVRIRLSSVGWTNPRRFGDVWLGLWLWKFLHLDEIVDRHLPQGKETIRPADIVAIEVINRLCGPCSEFALAEHWYASTALEDLLGVPDSAVTKDRLYRTLDRLLRAQDRFWTVSPWILT